MDYDYLSGLSADALPQLYRLPARDREITEAIEARLVRPDGLAGLNLSRAAARRKAGLPG
jgi:hypothetical protein